jgi:histidyl-tRNA synthetase
MDPSLEAALYYGFTPFPAPLLVTKEDRDRARELADEEWTRPFSIAPAIEERVALFRHCGEKLLQEGSHPLMHCGEFASAAPRRKSDGSRKEGSPRRERRVFLEIMGSQKSIAEATLIQTAIAILRDEGHEQLSLSLNSVGDRESLARFVRELGSYYRKHLAALPQSCRTLAKKSPLNLLECSHEKCKALSEEAPKSIGFLGDDSRRHFKEVLEFVEELEIPYQIDHRLLGSRAFGAETLFEVSALNADGGPSPLVSGARYTALGKRLGLRREAPSVGANLLLSRATKKSGRARRILFRKPVAFFLQLGYFAKLKSLRVIELLRQSGIPLYQALTRDKLANQLSAAENLKTPYTIIIGQREALENSVIVRNAVTRAQETVKIADLTQYVKRLRVG